MQIFPKGVLFGFLLAVFMVVSMPKVQAFELRESRDVTKDEVIQGNLFMAGESMKMEGTVHGNLYITGETLQITGNVDGDVFATGSVVSVSGDIGRSLHVAGGTIDVSSAVGRNAFIVGGQITFTGSVLESLYSVGGTIVNKGSVKEDLYTAGGQINIGGTVDRDAFISAGSATVNPTSVKGVVKLQTSDSAERKADVTINQKALNGAVSGAIITSVIAKIIWFVGMYIVGILLLKIFPVQREKVTKELTESIGAFAKNFGFGLLVYMAAPLAIIFLIVTLIGAPLALLVTMFLGLMLFVGGVWASYAVGKVLNKGATSIYVHLLLGQVVIGVVSMIPVLGFFVNFVLACAVLGAVISAKYKMLETKN